MKKTIIISFLLLMTASLAFSQNAFGHYGQKNNNNSKGMNNTQTFNRPDNHPRYGGEMVLEIVEMSGKITVNENTFPTLKSGKEDLSLLIGQNVLDTLKLKSGDSVKVNGFKVPGPNWNVDEKSALKVRELTINGKTYQVMGRGMPGRMHGGPGMMNGSVHGRAYGMNNDHHRQGNGNYGANRNFTPDNYGPKGNR